MCNGSNCILISLARIITTFISTINLVAFSAVGKSCNYLPIRNHSYSFHFQMNDIDELIFVYDLSLGNFIRKLFHENRVLEKFSHHIKRNIDSYLWLCNDSITSYSFLYFDRLIINVLPYLSAFKILEIF